VTGAANSLADAIATIKNAGGQNFLVVGLNESFPLNNATVRALRVAYDNALVSRLSMDGVSVFQASFNQTQVAIFANPAQFGFTSVSNTAGSTACTVPAGVTTAWALLCSSNASAPSQFASATADMTSLFADDQHYATQGSKMRANVYYSALPPATSSPLVAAILPSSRSVQVPNPATVFATTINSSSSAATGCRISPVTNVNGRFLYQTTDPATNQLTRSPNTPVTIPADTAQSFLLAFTPAAAQTSSDVMFVYVCAGMASAVPIIGVNTVRIVFDTNPVPDMIAVGLTPSNDGYSHTGCDNGTGLFAIASINIGVSASLTARARVSNASLPLTTTVCQTDPNTAQCLSTPAPTVTATVGQNQSTTWSAFLQASGPIAIDPANNRVFFEFVDAGGIVRGSTSTAVTTQ
jgi:hypothetical protein